MRRAAWLLLPLLIAAVVPAPAADEPQDPLTRARVLYNQRDFDEAIVAAEEAYEVPGQTDAADLVAARAYLERYRASAASDDLARARERLRRINPERFGVRERVELSIGLGTALYFEGSPVAAAGVFDAVLENGNDLERVSREGILDWWASSLDRDARSRPDSERQGVYKKLADRMHVEIGANPDSTVAAYWLAAAAAGQGDWEAAWDAAQAAWVRAPLMSDHGVVLRADVDSLIRHTIVPGRAKARTEPPDILLAEWESFKEKWTR